MTVKCKLCERQAWENGYCHWHHPETQIFKLEARIRTLEDRLKIKREALNVLKQQWGAELESADFHRGKP